MNNITQILNSTKGYRMFRNFFIFFVSFDNLYARMKIEKPKHLKLINKI